jgi:hypothetical protein
MLFVNDWNAVGRSSMVAGIVALARKTEEGELIVHKHQTLGRHRLRAPSEE